MNDLSRGEIIAIFALIFAVIAAVANWYVVQSRLTRYIAYAIIAVISAVFILWLVKSLSHDDGKNARLQPPDVQPSPSPLINPTPSPLSPPTPKSSPTPPSTPVPTREPTSARSPTPQPTLTPAPDLQSRQAPAEVPKTRPRGTVTLSFILLDNSVPVTGARVDFTAGGFSSTTYTRNGRATATVPCGVPGMWITFDYKGMRNSAPIRRGLKCQDCHFEAGPIDLGIPGTQCLEIRCGRNRTGCD